jgi:hypothetical protein
MPNSAGKRVAAGLAVAVAALLAATVAAVTTAPALVGAVPPAAEIGQGTAVARSGAPLAAERLLRRAVAATEKVHGPDQQIRIIGRVLGLVEHVLRAPLAPTKLRMVPPAGGRVGA